MTTIRNIEDFETVVRAFDARLKRYAVGAWGRRRMTNAVFRDLVDRGGNRLLSATAAARIAVARAAASELAAIMRVTRRRQAFFVTLTPSMGVIRLEEALRPQEPTSRRSATRLRPDLRARWQGLQAWAADLLAGTAFLGVVEVAYYGRHPTSLTDGPVACLHVHAIVWETSREALEASVARINASDHSLVPTLPAAHLVALNTSGRVVAATLYALKPPIAEYTAFATIGARSGRTWQQRTRPMRPGDAATVARLFAGVEIDDLMFEGGHAFGLKQRIAAAARRTIRRDERRLLRAIEKGRSG